MCVTNTVTAFAFFIRLTLKTPKRYYSNPRRVYMSLKFYTQRIPGKISHPKNYKTKYLSTDSFNQTDFKTKKNPDRSLDPKKNTKGVNFQPKKTTSDPLPLPSFILRVPPWDPSPSLLPLG